ncbi:MAG: choice-of-anchor D domain-containing protein [Planctomycetota bacterium]
MLSICRSLERIVPAGLILFWLGCVSGSAFAQDVIRINAGGPRSSDAEGRTWAKDHSFKGGQAESVSGRTGVFAHERTGTFRYDLALPDGEYQVTFFFGEHKPWTGLSKGRGPGFTIRIGDDTVLDETDLRPLDPEGLAWPLVVPASVKGGQLRIQLQSRNDDAGIAALQVAPSRPVEDGTWTSGGPSGNPNGSLGQGQLPKRWLDGRVRLNINAGGGAFVDSSGERWRADVGFTGGQSYLAAVPIELTEDDALYQSERFGDFEYQVDVPNGAYAVRVHFAEIFWGAPGGDPRDFAGQRVFDVTAEGETILAGVDLTGQVGSMKAFAQSFRVDVTDGRLDLGFVTVVDLAKVSAIQIESLAIADPAPEMSVLRRPIDFKEQLIGNESPVFTSELRNTGLQDLSLTAFDLEGANAAEFEISGLELPRTLAAGEALFFDGVFKAAGAGARTAVLHVETNEPSGFTDVALQGIGLEEPPAPQPVRINTGGSSFVDSQGRTWLEDTGFVDGWTYFYDAEIAGTEDDALYQDERYGNFQYALPLTDGSYLVRLHVCEIYWGVPGGGEGAPGQRLYTVSANGTEVLTDIDLFASFGPLNAATLEFPVEIQDGQLTLDFQATADFATVAALEILPQSGDPVLGVDPDPVLFGPVVEGQESEVLVELRNDGIDALDISDIVIGGFDADSFRVEALPPYLLTSGQSVTISVFCAPQTTGQLDGQLLITSNDASGVRQVALEASGDPGLPVLTVQPTPIVFDPVLEGQSGQPLDITLTNTGSGLLDLSSIDVEGDDAADFAFDLVVPQSLAPGQQATFQGVMTPSHAGPLSALLVLISDDANDAPSGRREVAISGEGIVAAPELTVTPSPIGFPATHTGESSNLTVTLRNTGTVALTISSILDQGDAAADFDFPLDQPLPWVLPPTTERSIEAIFTPSQDGDRLATLQITSDDPDDAGGVRQVAVSGVGFSTEPDLMISPAPVDFGSIALGESSPLGVTLSNGGDATLTITSIGKSGPAGADFSFPPGRSLPFDLAPSESMQIAATFTPAQPGERIASFDVVSNDPDDAGGLRQTVARGVALAPELTVTPARVDFGNVSHGDSSSVLPVTLTNSGASPLEVTGANIQGTDASAFVIADAPAWPIVLAPQESRKLDLQFTPTAGRSFQATLRILSDDPRDAGGERLVPVVGIGLAGRLEVTPTSFDFGLVQVGEASAPRALVLANTGTAPLSVDSQSIFGDAASDYFVDVDLPVVIQPSGSVTASVTLTPSESGSRDAEIRIVSDDPADAGGHRAIPVTGEGFEDIPIQFDRRPLVNRYDTPGAGEFLNPTSLMFGPDGRLYVTQQNGLIHVFTLDANRDVIEIEVIRTIYESQTFNENGTPATNAIGRQVTGIFVDPESSPSAPVIYVAHSDPRIGENNDDKALSIDTDGGVLTRLTGPLFDDPTSRVDMIEGLPRSRENHATNAIVRGPDGWLYLSQGGNTNYGAPSQFFSDLPEVPLSAGVLRFNVDAWSAPIDVSAGSQPGAVLGDGEIPGLFEVYAAGFRNGYDILWHSNGSLYLNENGGNAGLGNTPGPGDGCSSAVAINAGTEPDELFRVLPNGYGGHPNPSRGLCVYRDGLDYTPPLAPEPGTLTPLWDYGLFTSTNGLAEYESLAFGGQMLGDLLSVNTFAQSNIVRLQLSPDGNSVVGSEVLAGSLSGPIDLVVAPDGSIFVLEFFFGQLTLLTPLTPTDPNDNDGDGIPNETDPDDDNDGYTDLDEIANGTNPLSPADFPPDHDGDFVSDLLDDDDDNDGVLDVDDPFLFDATNGAGTLLPVEFEWNPGDPHLGGFRNSGFTGVQLTTNGQGLIPGNVSAGAAAGFLSIVSTEGDCLGSNDDLDNGLQIGLDATPGTGVGPFTVMTRLTAPFTSPPVPPMGGEAAGLMIGIGENDYLRLVAAADAGDQTGLIFAAELDGVYDELLPGSPVPLNLPGPSRLDLFLTVDPAQGTVTARYRVDSDDPTATVLIGTIDLTSHPELDRLLTSGLGVGVMATRRGAPDQQFIAVYDFFRVLPGGGEDLDTGSAAEMTIDPVGDSLADDTDDSGAFTLRNVSTSGQTIESVRIDLRWSVLRDLVFDPDGLAGDDSGKPFTIDFDDGVGLTESRLLSPHDGGFDVLELDFDEFEVGETLRFSIDVDPTSIRGTAAPGPGQAGEVSGVELAGARVRVTFSDGSFHDAQLAPSVGGTPGAAGRVISAPPSRPCIEVLGVECPSEVASPQQTVRVAAPVGASVDLYLLEGGFFESAPGEGFDVEPFEANTLIGSARYSATIGGSGFVDIPVDLLASAPEGGINHLVAIVRKLDGSASASPILILKRVP